MILGAICMGEYLVKLNNLTWLRLVIGDSNIGYDGASGII